MPPDDSPTETNGHGSLAGLTKSELDEQARKAGIAGRSRMTKKELVEALGSDRASRRRPTRPRGRSNR